VLFVLGAIALAIGTSWLGLGVGTFVSVFAVYIVLGWFVLMRLRRVIYADNRRNEEIKHAKQA
jgi:hypothetical protein